MPSNWPVDDDLTTFLQNAGALENPVPTPNPVYNAQELLDEAVMAWEKATNRRPFKATTQVQPYDPPGPPVSVDFAAVRGGYRKLFLRNGLITLNSLKVGVWNNSPGTQLVRGTQFWLRPSGANFEEKPYEWIEFAVEQQGQPESILIDGVWGWQTAIPQDAWNRVLAYAAALSLPQFGVNLTGGAVEVKIENDSFKFTGGAFANEANAWMNSFKQRVAKYRR